MGFLRRRWRGRGRIAVCGVAALVVIGTAVAWTLLRAEPAPSGGSGTARVDRGEVVTAVATTGSLEPAQTRTLGFATDGTVTAVEVRPGDQVKTGQVLAEIDATDAKERVDETRQALEDAEEALEDAEQALEDAEQAADVGTAACPVATPRSGQAVPIVLVATGGATPSPSASPSGQPSPSPTRTTQPPAGQPTASQPPRSGGDQAPGGSQAPGGGRSAECSGQRAGDPVLAAQQRVTSAEVALAEAEEQLTGTKIKAPIGGKVLTVAGAVGAEVGAGGTFVTLADVAGMQVAADVPEAYAGRLKIGQSATVTLANRPNDEFAARVVRIDPVGAADGNLVRYGVVLAFEEVPAELLVGQSANVRVRTSEVAGVLRAPSTAVRGDGTVVVRTATGDQARAVGVGLRGDQYTQITSGLIEGDEIVTAGVEESPS
ncbi:efflux RND transporter periplasmic adaptor subunit [Plantactinospora sp. KLBMP9567]|uniref:efflux RND transporter periplasmic adaptor subunit n=1 Tax=Plantactinospora sp. KLBMP9567 TaxID=3085900 RepID=UPI002980DDD3|nr:efflux RND transporter periplasmic adaptor subunit [Plantactinospora sp. KLBMP9567]MDW5323709.1 efflux RND transporter periplasmic adaptor subunit [Plantactinospora sp. KLBMP9567]